MTSTFTGSSNQASNAWKILAIILVANILQSIFTPLSNDEPYYLLYAQHLNWGYFDHPPMVAFLIRAGMAILPGELGFRLFSMLLGSLTCFVIYRIIERETDKPVNFSLAALFIFSSLFFNLYSFLALPDTPLLFFSTLFLYCYRSYRLNDTLLNTIVLGIVTALMLYSKYHGVLLVGFTILADFKLFKKPTFYAVIAITVALMIPHILWQVANDYPSIRFQLFERSKLAAEIDKSYIPKQLAITGPVILLLFSILYKPQNQFQKVLKYNVIGIFIFFFISSFKGLVNVHWTAIAWPGMICLSYLYVINWKKNQGYVTALLALNLLALVIVRIDLVVNAFHFMSYNEANPKVMVSMIKERSKGYPVVFEDMYNEPTFYSFYSGNQGYGVNTIYYKKTEFNFVPELENDFQNKTVCYVSFNKINNTSQMLSVPKGHDYYITYIPGFTSFTTGIKIKAADFKTMNADAANTLKLTIDNQLNTQRTDSLKAKKGYIVLNMTNKKTAKDFMYKLDRSVNLFDKTQQNISFTPKVEKGDYTCTFSIMTDDSLLPGFNSGMYSVKVN